MDSADCHEKSLPEMGIPRWMNKTTARYTYADICASPPSNEDGFMHISRHRSPLANPTSDGNGQPCFQNKNNYSSPNSDSSISETVSTKRQFPEGFRFGQGSQIVLAKQDCGASKEASNFYKTVATTPSSSTLVNLALASQTVGALPQATPKQLSAETATSGIGIEAMDKFASKKNITSLDSTVPSEDPMKTTIFANKPKAMEEMSGPASSQEPVVPTQTKINVILTYQPEDGTPSTTPSQTPTCSPQVARRSGNPFFSGSQDKSGPGSWLFRSSSSPVSSLNKSDKSEEFRNYSYEARGELGQGRSVGGNAQPQKGRLVPRPSELRELNFWSPTSM